MAKLYSNHFHLCVRKLLHLNAVHEIMEESAFTEMHTQTNKRTNKHNTHIALAYRMKKCEFHSITLSNTFLLLLLPKIILTEQMRSIRFSYSPMPPRHISHFDPMFALHFEWKCKVLCELMWPSTIFAFVSVRLSIDENIFFLLK